LQEKLNTWTGIERDR